MNNQLLGGWGSALAHLTPARLKTIAVTLTAAAPPLRQVASALGASRHFPVARVIQFLELQPLSDLHAILSSRNLDTKTANKKRLQPPIICLLAFATMSAVRLPPHSSSSTHPSAKKIRPN